MASLSEVKSRTDSREVSTSPKNQVAALLKNSKKRIEQVLPKHITPERLMQVAFHAVSNNEMLLKCEQTTLLGAIIQSATLGLEPNTVLGQSYLVPFWNGRARRYEVQFIPGYRGMITLARNSGNIISITAKAVRENDEFSFEYGMDEHLRHRPAMGDRGEITYFYAYAQLKGGGHQFEVLTRDDVNRARDASQGYQQAKKKGHTHTPWIQHYEAMGQKTAVRRLFKWLPCSVEMRQAEVLDAKAEANEGQSLDSVLEGNFSHVETQSVNISGPELPEQESGSERERALAEHGFFQDEAGVITNAHGELFDEEEHQRDSNGVPVINADGSFRKRRKKSPPASSAKSANGDADAGQSAGEKESQEDDLPF